MTIVDIAKEAGYSVSTVSRVLNGRRDVSEEARDRIMRIVEAYQFVPNNNAKHLKQTVSQSILILVKGTSNMLFTNIIEVIQDTIEGSDYSLRVHYLDEDADEVKEAVRMCREHKPMGILFLGGNIQYFHEEFELVNVPCVLVTDRADKLGFRNLASVSTMIWQLRRWRLIICLITDIAILLLSGEIWHYLPQVNTVKQERSAAL